MSDAILRLSTMHFDDAADLDMGDEPVDGTRELPLIAYELSLPLVEQDEAGTMPILFKILAASAPARIAG